MSKIDEIREHIARCHPDYQKDTFAQNVLSVCRSCEIAESALRKIRLCNAYSEKPSDVASKALAEIEAL